MTASVIRERLHSYLDVADDRKVKALYTLIENDIEANFNEIGDHWADEEFVAEMNQRAADMDSGRDEGRSWEEVHNSVRFIAGK